MKAKLYKARKTSSYSNKDAQIIGKFIEVNFPNGNLTPLDLLKSAKPIKSSIHKYFEWDDTKAAHKWRLEQAREIISILYIEVNDIETRAYESIYIENEGREYKNINSILDSSKLLDQVLDKAIQEITYWENRYKNLSELRGIFKEIKIIKRKRGQSGKEKTRKNPRGKQKKR